MSYLDDSAALLTHFEGSVPWMYLDTRGFVTVAVGDMLPNVSSAQALKFVNTAGQPASSSDILADFQRVAAMASGLSAASYRVSSSLQLPSDAVTALLMVRLQEFDSALSDKLANYGSFPEPAKLGLLDMAFNLGTQKLFSTYPTFMRDVANADWTGASQQCHRVGPSPARNAWTLQQFQLAASQPTSNA